MTKIALLIGVSEYHLGLSALPSATKDVDALQLILQDPDLGGFSEVKVLKNPEPQEMQYQIEALFAERAKEDLLLLYFSGHGLKDDSGNLFFATSITKKTSKGQLIRATAVPAYFIHEVMGRSRAKRQVIILDCCFSGAFDPNLSTKNDASIDVQSQLGAEGRVVLTSSSSTEYSFENKTYDLSIYTRHLVEGIKTGLADLDGDGQISIADLHDYVEQKTQEQISGMSPRIIVLKDKGYDIIISKKHNPIAKISHKNAQKDLLGKIQLEPTVKSINRYYNPIPSLLQPMESFIKKLSEGLEQNGDRFSSSYLSELQNEEVQNSILEVIRKSSEADFVFVLHRSDRLNEWSIKSQSNLSDEIDEVIYPEILKNEILSNLSIESIFTSDYHGIYRIKYDEKSACSKAFILVPLETKEFEFIVICGILNDSYLLNDSYGRIISSFYRASQRFFPDPIRIEAFILDDLKRNYGYVPFSLYEKRFSLFRDRLSKTLIHFEPILDLDTISISAWEALARDPDSLTAPIDLFSAAELWGRKFTIELDQILLRKAVTSYQEARMRSKQSRSYEILPLSVNVYPESLMRTAYFETVREIVKEGKANQIPSKKLILEISEKSDLPVYQNGVRLESPLDTFKEKLSQYVQELGIRFGIDDFGVGYASVSRLSGLNTPYVKVDREILYHQPVDIILRFVKELVSSINPLNPADIIVEGLDESSPVSLRHLRDLGISYVQGHVIGVAGPEVYRLSSETSQSLKKEILGE